MPLCRFLAVSNCPPTYCLMKDVFCGYIAAVYRCFAHIHMFCCSYHPPLMLGCIFQQSAYLSAGLTRTDCVCIPPPTLAKCWEMTPNTFISFLYACALIWIGSLLAILPSLPSTVRFQKRSDVLKYYPHLNPDSKLICLAVHLWNEHCATSELIALFIIIFLWFHSF